MPTKEQLRETTAAVGSAHHDYESNFLDGVRGEASGEEDWATASCVAEKLGEAGQIKV